MTVLNLQEAVERTGTSKVDIWRAIRAGALTAKRTDHGGFAIDPDDLFAVFETKQADQSSAGEGALASVEAPESPETSPTSETDLASDVTVEALGTGLQGDPKLPVRAPASDETRQNWDEGAAADLAERNAQVTEPAAGRAKVEMMARNAVVADEHGGPWWMRLVGWIRTRRGRAARKRLRERLYG